MKKRITKKEFYALFKFFIVQKGKQTGCLVVL